MKRYDIASKRFVLFANQEILDRLLDPRNYTKLSPILNFSSCLVGPDRHINNPPKETYAAL
jgi:hypothetical protein